MKILAIDPGTKLGFCIIDDTGVVKISNVNLTPKRNESKGMVFVRLREWFQNIIEYDRFDIVYYEEVRKHQGTDAAHRYGGIISYIQEICEANDVMFSSVPVGKWKKHLTGRGSASKDIYISHVRHKGFSPKTEDEAAAVGIGLWAWEVDLNKTFGG